MAKPSTRAAGAAACILALFSCQTQPEVPDRREISEAEGVAATAPMVPRSLSALYPPQADAPVYTMHMYALAGALEGLVADVMEGDAAGAAATLARLTQEVRRGAELVPEWAGAYPTAEVRAIERALSAGDPPQVMAAVEQVGAACHGCHVAALGEVQHRYRWPMFARVMVPDAASGQALPYASFMGALGVDFARITHSIAQGQPDNARAAFASFEARMSAMQGSCASCHPTERRYYVGDEVMQQVSSLGRALSGARVDEEAVARLTRSIGEQSCGACHRVHLPAAFAQERARKEAASAELARRAGGTGAALGLPRPPGATAARAGR
jgi:cytochrome c556